MDLGLKDATVLVSGGTGGMGRAAAECFAADGARVAVMARSRDDLDATVEALKSLGAPDAVGLQVDLFDAASVDAAIAELDQRWGQLNALVNAAGPLAGGLKNFETYTDDEWQSVYSGLLMGVVRTIRAALPHRQCIGDVHQTTVPISCCVYLGQGSTYQCVEKSLTVSCSRKNSREYR
jgi:3-oxoacyl-[acyl-carrier protein] reductase